jgi:general secretion pathway protein L
MRSTVGLVLVAFACGVAWLQTCAALPGHPAWIGCAGFCALAVLASVRARLRPAAWIVGVALTVHALALVVDWTRLASEQSSLRARMESRFRAAFPEAVAVADPALQMRRKLTDARHAAGQTDSADFLPMIEKIATALKEAPAGALRIASYESGRMTLELAAVEEAGVRRIVARLLQAGMRVDAAPAGTRGGSATVVLTVRSS